MGPLVSDRGAFLVNTNPYRARAASRESARAPALEKRYRLIQPKKGIRI